MSNQILTYFEDKISFSYSTWCKEYKNGDKVVYIRPSISIVQVTPEQIKKFTYLIGLEHKSLIGQSVTEKNKTYDYVRLAIQSAPDAAKVISVMNEYEFINPKKRERYQRFLKTFNFVKKIGSKHVKMSDDLKEFITLQQSINGKRKIKKEEAAISKLDEFFANPTKLI